MKLPTPSVVPAKSSPFSFSQEKRFQALIEHSTDGIVLMNRLGKLLYISPSATRMFGYTFSKISLLKPFNFIHPADRKKVMTTFFHVMKQPKKPFVVTFRVKHSNGTYRSIHGTATNLLSDPDIQGLVINFRDITEQIKNEKRHEILHNITTLLTSSLAYDETIKEALNSIVPSFADYSRLVIINSDNQITEIRVNHKDKQKQALVEKLYESYMQQPDNTHGVGKIISSRKAEMISVVNEDVVEHFNTNKKLLKIITQLGLSSYIGVPLIARGKFLGVLTFSSTEKYRIYDYLDLLFAQEIGERIAIALDNALLCKAAQDEIEDRKQAEKRIKERETWFHALLEKSLDGVRVVDTNGKILYASASTQHILGYTPQEYQSQNVLDLIHPDDKQAYQQIFAKALQHPGKAFELIYRIKHKDGTYRWIEGIGRNLLHDPYVKAVVSNFRDISERMDLERRKSEFISVASHELRTPVTSIKLFTQVLKKHITSSGDEKSIKIVNRLVEQTNKLHELIRSLLDVSRIELGKLHFSFEVFNLADLLITTVEDIQTTTERHHINLVKTTPSFINGDRFRLYQVITNLLTNAIKYSPDGGIIEITLTHDKQQAVMSVKDHGIGIFKKDLAQIFDRLYQAKSATDKTFSGLGMGLYISKEIIERHNGKIWADSRRGKGSTFYIALPLAN